MAEFDSRAGKGRIRSLRAREEAPAPMEIRAIPDAQYIEPEATDLPKRSQRIAGLPFRLPGAGNSRTSAVYLLCVNK